MENLLEKLNSTKLNCYIRGDLYIDLLKTDIVNTIKNYMDMIYSLGSILLIKHPTRITQTSSTLIDHIYSNNVSDNINSCILLKLTQNQQFIERLLHQFVAMSCSKDSSHQNLYIF